MKPHALILTFLLLAVSAFGQSGQRNTMKSLKLLGNVKSVTMINKIDHLAEDNGTHKSIGHNEQIKEVLQFNVQKSTTSRLKYYTLDALYFSEQFTYDSLGSETEKIEIRYFQSDTTSTRYINHYDVRFNLIQVEVSIDFKPFEPSSRFKYDSLNQKTGIYPAKIDPLYNRIQELKYDSKGNMEEVVMTTILNNDTTSYTQTFEFDDQGNYLKYESRNHKNELTFEATRKFDKHGSVIYWTGFRKDDGALPAQTTKYTYDLNGNWITKTVYENGQIIDDFVRTIEYY